VLAIGGFYAAPVLAGSPEDDAQFTANMGPGDTTGQFGSGGSRGSGPYRPPESRESLPPEVLVDQAHQKLQEWGTEGGQLVVDGVREGREKLKNVTHSREEIDQLIFGLIKMRGDLPDEQDSPAPSPQPDRPAKPVRATKTAKSTPLARASQPAPVAPTIQQRLDETNHAFNEAVAEAHHLIDEANGLGGTDLPAILSAAGLPVEAAMGQPVELEKLMPLVSDKFAIATGIDAAKAQRRLLEDRGWKVLEYRRHGMTRWSWVPNGMVSAVSLLAMLGWMGWCEYRREKKAS